MKTIFYLNCLILFVLTSCSPKIQSVYRHYDEYYLKESYFNSKDRGEGGVQIYIMDSIYKKGEKLFITNHIYSFDKNKSVVTMMKRERKILKPFVFCNCTDSYFPFNHMDSLIKLRFIQISDSLNWDKNTFLKSMNGYKAAKK